MGGPFFSAGVADIVSGIPWVTGATAPASASVHISFPAVTRFISVCNVSGTTGQGANTQQGILTVAFSQGGLNPAKNNQFTLQPGQERTYELRTTDLWISATQGTPAYEVVAGLTSVLRASFLQLTGSAGALFSGIG